MVQSFREKRFLVSRRPSLVIRDPRQLVPFVCLIPFVTKTGGPGYITEPQCSPKDYKTGDSSPAHHFANATRTKEEQPVARLGWATHPSFQPGCSPAWHLICLSELTSHASHEITEGTCKFPPYRALQQLYSYQAIIIIYYLGAIERNRAAREN